jgi:two-component system CheB/CheR fusion protein
MSQSVGDGSRMRPCGAPVPAPSRQTALSELCRTTVLEAYGPAAVLINHKLECLHFQGPTDRYLKVASGRPSQDLIAMAREGVRTKLKSAVQGALRTNARFVCPVERINGEAGPMSFSVVAEPVLNLREELLLVCFVEEPTGEAAVAGGDSMVEIPRVGELERELQETKLELHIAVHQLETTSQEQMMINEEALSVNEEYQSTNQELLASKEEVQSLNEELNALNSQLLQTLARQRTTADDLQNVLYSSDVATIFLDTRFNIRFFTPATKALFSFIPSDVRRPLADLKSLTLDSDLLSDAQAVLESQAPIEREVQNQSGAWFTRRILPYRVSDKTEGVVITFQNITERRRGADALSVAKRQA